MKRKPVVFKPDGKKDMDSNWTFCMAPFTHTYISPQSERRICCASREQAQFIRQYIDKDTGAQKNVYEPTTLEEHWNSEFMKRVRKQMLSGELVPECEVCNDKVLNLSTYRAWFTDFLFREKIEMAFAMTDDSGFTKMKPVSFDYRIFNTCNFKCRMCGHQLSSSWEQELRKEKAWSPVYDAWMEPELNQKISEFQKNTVGEELRVAAQKGEIEEIYWVGGEPLVWDLHWEIMKTLVDLGHANKVYCRYNTNLSKIEHRGVHLFRDLLPSVKDYIMCCSIDGTGAIGEWIRTGLNWKKWVQNFDQGLLVPGKRDQMKVDLTLTLPGLFSLKDLVQFSVERDVEILTKLVFAFTPDKVISPLALPKAVLHPFLDDLIAEISPIVGPKQRSVIQMLQDLKTRKVFEESFPEQWEKGFQEGRAWLQKLAKWRGDGAPGKAITLESIYASRAEVLSWWNQ